MDRRDFRIAAGGTVLAAGSAAYGVSLLAAPKASQLAGKRPPAGRRWGMVIDLNRCLDGCTDCLEACREENNVAFFGDDRWDIHWIRKVTIHSKHSEHALRKTVLLLCNHCDNPPCAQVCPVKATYKRPDGIVLVDHHRCIGCRYCVMSCTYNARYFNFRHKETDENGEEWWPNKDYPKRSHGVAESCNLCAHLLDRKKYPEDPEFDPACVARCKKKVEDGEMEKEALAVGDLNNPKSNVSRLIEQHSPKRIREDLGTEPKVYYIGL